MKLVSTDSPGEGAAEVSQGNDALFLSFYFGKEGESHTPGEAGKSDSC